VHGFSVSLVWDHATGRLAISCTSMYHNILMGP